MPEALLALRSHQKEENASSLARKKCLGKAAGHPFSSIPGSIFWTEIYRYIFIHGDISLSSINLG